MALSHFQTGHFSTGNFGMPHFNGSLGGDEIVAKSGMSRLFTIRDTQITVETEILDDMDLIDVVTIILKSGYLD